MLYHKQGFPEESEIVLCTVTNIQYNSVFATLDEYSKQGMIHISEISPGRIRNIRDYVKEGKKIVCKVLRVNEVRGHIDLSLRRVNEAQKKNKVNEIKQEQRAENIIAYIAKQQKREKEAVYKELTAIVFIQYSSLFEVFMDVVEGRTTLEKLGVSRSLAAPLEKEIKERIKKPEVTIQGNFHLVSYASDGINLIKVLWDKCHNQKTTVSYYGGGTYHISITAKEYKEAEKILKSVREQVEKEARSIKAELSFERDER